MQSPSFIRAAMRGAVVCALVVGIAACAMPGTPGPAAQSSASASATDVMQIRRFLTHVEQVFDAGDLDAAVAVFADDAVIANQGVPDAVGRDAIHALYAGALAKSKLRVRFHTEEIEPRADLAYERGTYDLTISDKGSGQVLAKVTNRHVHILRRQPNGEWRTWRLFTNSAQAPATASVR